MKKSIFYELEEKELEKVRAGVATVNMAVQEVAASGHGYAVKCCSDNGGKDTTTTQKPIESKPVTTQP